MTTEEAYRWIYEHYTPCGDGTAQDDAVTIALDAMMNSMSHEIITEAQETTEHFIFTTIYPFCENVVQRNVSKRELTNALLLYEKVKQIYGEVYEESYLCNAAIDALKKQIPVRWKKENRGGVEYTAVCPKCGYGTYWSDASMMDYCCGCGQRIDMSED